MVNNQQQLFWQKVDKSAGDDGCWLWTGGARGRKPLMYGVAWINGRFIGAHRYSYELVNGPIPEGGDVRGMCVLHKCDTPLCVNPLHLFIGTHTDNMQDKTIKGRGRGSITHCKRGHEFTDKNTYRSKSGLRHCRKCHAEHEHKRRAKLKACGG